MIAFAAFSQDKLMDMIRSAALLSPIAHLGEMSSPLGKVAADAFLAEVGPQMNLLQFKCEFYNFITSDICYIFV